MLFAAKQTKARWIWHVKPQMLVISLFSCYYSNRLIRICLRTEMLMKCPACFNQLTTLQVGSLEVDVCQGGCGGIWFDAFELQQVDQPSEVAGEALLHIQRDEGIVLDMSRKRDCPRCGEGMKLHRHFFSAKRKVEVDQCPNCGGYWLDAGELAAIRAETAEAEAIAQTRHTITPSVIRYLYRLESEKRRQT